MKDNIVVIYGSGASHASGYRIKIPESNKSDKPLMDRGFFDNDSVKRLINEKKYYPIHSFIELYFKGRNDIGLEEFWTAVDLNHKHITLGTYDWHAETFDDYLFRMSSFSIPYRTMDRAYFSETGTETYNDYKFLGDCGRNLKELIYDIFSDFELEEELSNYAKLHQALSESNSLLGYITFNYDLILEDSLKEKEKRIRYINVNEDINSTKFLGDKVIDNVIIVKLHGSLNWEFSSRGKPDKPIIYKDNSIKPEYIQNGNYIEPAIIPPTLFKQEINDDSRAAHPLTQTILSQWKAAIRLITEADKLLFVGYSFPPTDFHASRIFQIAMMQKRSMGKGIKILYCGGDESHDDKIKQNLNKVFVPIDEPTIKNNFDDLCDSETLSEFLEPE